MFYLFALTGFTLSLSYFLAPEVCTVNCDSIFFNTLLPNTGAFYFLLTVFIYHHKRKKCLTWVLPIGLGIQSGIFFSGILAGTWCHVCFVILAVNGALFLSYIITEKTIKHSQISGVVIAMFLTFSLGNVIFASSNLNNASGEFIKPETVKASTEKSELKEPSVIKVYDLAGDTVRIDLKQSPVLIWYPYCDPCKEYIPRISNDLPLLAMWVEDPEDIKSAHNIAAGFNKETYFVNELDVPVEAVPALLYWDQEDFSIKTTYDIPTD